MLITYTFWWTYIISRGVLIKLMFSISLRARCSWSLLLEIYTQPLMCLTSNFFTLFEAIRRARAATRFFLWFLWADLQKSFIVFVPPFIQ